MSSSRYPEIAHELAAEPADYAHGTSTTVTAAGAVPRALVKSVRGIPLPT
ncbi:hypothetical protein ACIRQP_22610 [Streptomyces sp. NPDC102274]